MASSGMLSSLVLEGGKGGGGTDQSWWRQGRPRRVSAQGSARHHSPRVEHGEGDARAGKLRGTQPAQEGCGDEGGQWVGGQGGQRGPRN